MSQQDVFKAIADPTRRAIIELLTLENLNLNDVVAHFEMSRPAVAKHINILSKSGLVKVETRGRERIHRLQPAALKTATDWLNYYSQFWDEKLTDLKTAVEADHE